MGLRSSQLRSASIMVPSHLLSQENIGHSLRREFLVHRRGVPAFDQRQTGGLVPGDHRRLGIRLLIVRGGQSFTQQVSHGVL